MTEEKPIKVLLADDHSVIREGIKAVLSNEKNIQVCFECEDGKEVLPILRKIEVDIVLMDLVMPGLNGIESTKLILSEFPDVLIIAFTMHNQMSFVNKFIEAGAKGYVLKSSGAVELAVAIKEVYNGGIFFSQNLDFGNPVSRQEAYDTSARKAGD